MGERVFFLIKNTIEVVRLNTVFNTIICTSVEPDVLSTPKRAGI